MSFITIGWFPFILGMYLTYREEYVLAVGCFLISFCGFRHVCEAIKNREKFKGLESRLGRQQYELSKTKRLIEQRDKEIYILKNYDD